MPTPRPGEAQDEFISRCVPIVSREHKDLSNKAVVGRCFGIYRSSKKKGTTIRSEARRQ